MALTNKEVDGLEYPYGNATTSYVVQDSGTGSVRGFGVRVYPPTRAREDERKVFVYRYSFAGRRRIMTLGEYCKPQGARPGYPVAAARADAKEAERKVQNGIDPLTEREALEEAARREREARKTVADLAAEYMDALEDEAKPSTLRNYRQLLDTHLLPRFGKRLPASITEADVRRFKRSMRKAPYVFNRCAFLLRALIDKGGVSPRENPARGGKHAPVKRYREHPRRRDLSAAEVARLGEALRRLEAGAWVESEKREATVSPQAAAAIRMLAITGCRVNEVLRLRWEDVDRERGYATIREHKTSNTADAPKTIPLTSPVLDILDGLPRTEGHPYIFEGIRAARPLTDLRRPWQRAVELAGLENVRLHDLRHTVGSVGASGGLAGDEDRDAPMTLRVVGGVLGHKSMQSTDRYAHVQDETTRAAAAQIAARIAEAMEREVEDGADVVPINREAGR